MTDFSPTQIDTIRRRYIRDLAVASPAEYLSPFNKARAAQFFTDADLNAFKASVENDFGLELASVYDAKKAERLDAGDTDSAASAIAQDIRDQATFRLVRAECFRLMILDSGFQAAVSDKELRETIIAEMRRQILEDQNFFRTRTSGTFSSVPFLRR